MFYNLSPVIFPSNIKPVITRLIEHSLFIERMIPQLAFKKEMKDFYDNHPKDEDIELPEGFFEAFEDKNIQIVLDLLTNLYLIIESILNLNNVESKDLEFLGMIGLRFDEEEE